MDNVLMSERAPGASPHAVSPSWQARAVRVAAPGRLHLGFLDPAGTLGRRFGSLGLVVQGFETELELQFADADRLHAGDAAGEEELPRAQQHLQALRRASGREQPLQLKLLRVLPAHAGLGSGTQLALALGHAFAQLHGLPWSSADVARITGRGLRSGVGIAGFERGGLLLDGGPGRDGRAAPLLARLELPAAWCVLLALDPRLRGLSGEEERAALAKLAPLPREAAAEASHQVLMRVLPGAADEDFALFAAGLNRLQAVLGEHFAPVQAAGAFASPAVARLMHGLQREAGAGVGQSSWGPTGFAFLPSEAAAQAALQQARAAGLVDAALNLRVVRARSQGATITRVLPPR
jgi:beta-RFAP synthase